MPVFLSIEKEEKEMVDSMSDHLDQITETLEDDWEELFWRDYRDDFNSVSIVKILGWKIKTYRRYYAARFHGDLTPVQSRYYALKNYRI